MRFVLGFLAAAAVAFGQLPDFPVNLRQGVMAGEVTAESALLQARLTSTYPWQDTAWEGVRGADGVAWFEIADNPEFRDSRRSGWLEALPRNDFIVKTTMRGLLPDTRYHYRLHFGPSRATTRVSDPASFRTHAGPAGAAPYSLAIVTGMNYSFFHHTGSPGRNDGPYTGPDKALGYPALEAIRKLAPDYFVGTGDNVYYDHPGHGGRAQTLHEMRKKHHEQYSQPRFLDLFGAVATYWMKDDHDHRFDDSDAINPVRIRAPKQEVYYPKTNLFEGESGSGFAPSHELGLAAFREQLPIVDPADADAKTYRTHRVSRDLQVWFVEGRDYRSPLDMPDGPDKTIWGAEQKAWLKRTLAASDATFKLLVSPTPMVGSDSADKRDNHTDFNGYRYEGDEFFAWLAEARIPTDGFFIACGDRHWQYHAIRPDGYEEFSSGALVTENAIVGVFPGDKNSTDPEGKIRQPHHPKQYGGGFLVITVEPDGDAAKARFEFYDTQGKQLYRHGKRRAR